MSDRPPRNNPPRNQPQHQPLTPGPPSNRYPMNAAPAPTVHDQAATATSMIGDRPAWAGQHTNAPAARPRRTWMMIGAASSAVLVLIIVVGVIVGLRGNGTPGPGPAPVTTMTPSLTAEGAPGDVRIADHGSTITLTWTDPTHGTVQFAVISSQKGAVAQTPKLVNPGTTTLTIQGLNTTIDYCYQVYAVYSVSKIAQSPLVCTHRQG